MFIHFLQKVSLIIFPTRENLHIGAYKLLLQIMCVCKDKWMFTLQDDLKVHLLCSIWNTQKYDEMCWNIFDYLLKRWLCYMVLS